MTLTPVRSTKCFSDVCSRKMKRLLVLKQDLCRDWLKRKLRITSIKMLHTVKKNSKLPSKLYTVWRQMIQFVCCLLHRDSTDDLLLLQSSSGGVLQTRDLHLLCNTLYLLSPHLCFFIVLRCDLYVYRDDSLTSRGSS